MPQDIPPTSHKRYTPQIIKGQIFSLTGGLIAGSLLSLYTDKLYLIPGIFVLLPGFLELQGGINGAMAARIGSIAHKFGVDKVDDAKDEHIKSNVFASIFLNFTASAFLGLLSFFLVKVFFKEEIPQLIAIPLIAAFFASTVLIPITEKVSSILYKRGIDPDNVMGPIVTSIGDVVSTASILIAIFLLT